MKSLALNIRRVRVSVRTDVNTGSGDGGSRSRTGQGVSNALPPDPSKPSAVAMGLKGAS